jgi:hypothetical protein
MAKRKMLRLYRDGDVWVVKKDGSHKASAIRNTKEEAWEAARIIAINQNLTITVHGRDNKIMKVISPRQASNNDCFLTTACVKYYRLSDDCYQLTTLRNFRDSYLLKDNENISLIDTYYKLAPRLVLLLESNENRKLLFKEIFDRINLACKEIERRDYEKAKKIYVDAVFYLTDYFQILSKCQ